MDIQTAGSNKRGKEKPSHNKRIDHRHTLELDTEVHFREQALKGMFRCSTSNIGLQGAFFPAKNLPITYKTEIDLVFHACTKPNEKQYRLCARLVRLQENGAAMIFCPDDAAQAQDFRRFLLKAKVAARKQVSEVNL